MNFKTATLATVLALAAGAAAADDITVDTTPFTSVRSRAEVQAELQQFRASGVNPWSQAYNPLKAFRGSRTRAEVQAEFQAARQQAAALHGEDSGSFALAAPARPAASLLAGQPRAAQ